MERFAELTRYPPTVDQNVNDDAIMVAAIKLHASEKSLLFSLNRKLVIIPHQV